VAAGRGGVGRRSIAPMTAAAAAARARDGRDVSSPMPPMATTGTFTAAADLREAREAGIRVRVGPWLAVENTGPKPM